MFEKLLAFITGKNISPDERDLHPHLFKPKNTTGSIVFLGLMKVGAIMLVSWFLVERFSLYSYSWIVLLALWVLAIYPAFLDFQKFKLASKIIEENSLCAKCKFFDETGLLCTIFDEHVSATHTPCGGVEWEAKSNLN